MYRLYETGSMRPSDLGTEKEFGTQSTGLRRPSGVKLIKRLLAIASKDKNSLVLSLEIQIRSFRFLNQTRVCLNPWALMLDGQFHASLRIPWWLNLPN
jgi:hypothetical protein